MVFSLALSLHLFAESLSRLHGETAALLQPVEALEGGVEPWSFMSASSLMPRTPYP